MNLSERDLIRLVRTRAARGSAAVLQGIGDDCARLAPQPVYETLVTTDFSLEEVHFRRALHPAESVGHRALARGLSDVAAMGGEPMAAFLSLALPEKLPQRWVDGFLRGFLALARKFGVVLAGGDTAESPGGGGILADVVVVGRVPKGQAVLRSGARPGDGIYVTGELGGSAAVLHQLRESGRSPKGKLHAAHFFPVPRVAAGCALRQKRLASAMIDVSDGLSTDLSHICEESGVGALVNDPSVPRPVLPGASSLHFALHGGDDYELLFTAPRSRPIPAKIAGVRVTRIGEIVKAKGMWLVDAHGQRKPLEARGWQHFAG
ncbi:MAG TPA: thiamine-phosphate kinase [Terriglobales bacterium]|nr:thiamine-phosphate kinase [Terriglobales bacterium]